MSSSLSTRKSFEISKWEVWQAYQQVRANKLVQWAGTVLLPSCGYEPVP